MTIDQFFTALATCKDHFTWRQPTAQDPEIRGIKCRGLVPGTRAYCPVTAVASVLLRRYYPVSDPDHAALALHFFDDAVCTVVIAADDMADEHDALATGAMRARLLAVLGLRAVEA